MAARRVLLSALLRGRFVTQNQTRATHILRHVFAPPSTPPGGVQRHPKELQDLSKYEYVENETEKPAGPLKVILLQDVEGIGHQFDVVEVDRELARNDLLLTRKAVYASPFDLQHYGQLKEKMKDELRQRIRVPYEYVTVGRELEKLVVPLMVSMENSWTLNRSIALSSLRHIGVYVTDGAVFLPKDPITGPNFEIEAKLIRFYVVVNKQYVVPMLGRISHISSDESKEALYPEAVKQPTPDQLRKFGISVESPYFHSAPEIDDSFDVFTLMQSRSKNL